MLYKKIIEDEMFFHHFQPILDINTNAVIGYEGLFRTPIMSNLDSLFLTAKKEGWLYELDSLSIQKAVTTYQKAGFTKEEGKLFINIFPSTLLNPKFPAFLRNNIKDELTINQEVILEIVEHETITDYELLNKNIDQLREYGFSIAIDDLGNGFGDFKKIIELEPDYIKLDRFFSHNLNDSKKKQEIIKHILKYCERFNIRLILEGLETTGEIKTAKTLGVLLGQGYELGKPYVLSLRL